MIVYEDSKRCFVEDIKSNCIADKITAKIRERGINAGHEREYISWQNSLQFMRNIVDDNDIDDEVRIAIEYNIPLTSKRVDFIICGADANNNDNVVVVELKQWQKAEVVADDMHYCVKTFVGRNNRIVCHPSYQAYSYACFIRNYSQTVLDDGINLIPCAYLHNYDPDFKQTLSNSIYKEWVSEAPFFIRNETEQFSAFVKKYVTRRSSNGDLLYKIDHGRLKPTKTLQDSLASMVKGNKEFMLLDEQAVCYDMCLKTMAKCKEDGKKRTIVIQGGPGTGKSVLAVNLLMEFINKSLNTCYATKNSAPREAFLSLLTHSDAKKQVNIKQLFRSPFGLSNVPDNTYDCLIVDEAHRLVKKMYGDWNGENQVKECISASLLSIFLLDEDQAVTVNDIGSIAEISKWCRELNSTLKMPAEAKLVSQFRCNGSDAYIQFIDDILQRTEESVTVSLYELNFDFRIFDSAIELREALREKNAINNKSRMVAGYCYDWNVKHGRGDYDIMLPDGFKAKWNLEKDKIWAINPNSFEEVGCIHTAQGLEFDYVG
ncbi:MAG: DNA/RNA helicase domain-containing protein, partial [Roseburia sp.]|nr:DNA/RNA helicase domain-containing protein [Roseburia sp.]